ncbi:hypothetical protein AB833_14035 [Chromatiales bacterium (ex Bugula neritina AB1)]|nr:hypothetical protein AB833_14035 [Chromatiales bacterium (ex Bugula neritina AB1)]
MERYRLEISPRKKSARWEDIRMRKVQRDEIARIKLAALSHEDFEDWIERERAKGLKDASIRREFGVLCQVCRMCRKWRWMTHNPTELVEKPKNSKPRKRRISNQEIEAICAELKVNLPCKYVYQEVGLVWLLAIETGMRCSEITTLEKRQLFLEDYYLHLEETKNGDERDVPLSPRAIEIINSVPGRGDRVFRVRSKSVDTIYRNARDKLNIKDLRFHDSRHEAASRFVRDNKYNLMELCAVMGWRDPKMAQDYYAPTASELARRLRD